MADAYDLKQCPDCDGWIPATATMCAQCGSSRVDRAAPPRAPELPRAVQQLTATKVLVWANVAYFVFSLLVQWRLDIANHRAGSNALQYILRGPDGALAAGWYDHRLVVEGQWWRVITATFLHAGLFHIGMNMYALIQLGPLCEHLIGRTKFIVVYLTCAACSTLAISVWFIHVQGQPGHVPMVGASGAIFGILGVLITFLKRKGNRIGQRIARSLAINAAVLIAIGLVVRFISNTGHVGGFLPGLVFGMLLGDEFVGRFDQGRAVLWRRLAIAAVAVTVVALGAGIEFTLPLFGIGR